MRCFTLPYGIKVQLICSRAPSECAAAICVSVYEYVSGSPGAENSRRTCRDAEPGAKSKSIYRFTDVREVAIAARCCRQWIDEDTVELDAVTLSEQIIKAGMMQLPQDPRELPHGVQLGAVRVHLQELRREKDGHNIVD
jgi:hypothetical protein